MTVVVVVDENGNEVEDPVSFLPVPIRYDIVLDAKHYDIRTVARAVQYGHPYVPHTRRVLSPEEIDRVIADSVYARAPSRCGSYRRKRGSYQDLYDDISDDDDDDGRWAPARAWDRFVANLRTDAGVVVLDALDPRGTVSKTLSKAFGPNAGHVEVFEETMEAVEWLVVEEKSGKSPSDRRARLAVVRTNFDVVMDALLLYAHERSWTS